jgi:hypothetical protein
VNTTPTEHVGIAALFIDWKKQVAANSKMKNFLQNLVNGKTENLTPKKAKGILEVLQEQAKEILKEVEK